MLGQTGKGPSPGPGRPISRPVTSRGWIGSSLHEQATFNASVRRHDKAPPWVEGGAQQEPANAATDDNQTGWAHGTARTHQREPAFWQHDVARSRLVHRLCVRMVKAFQSRLDRQQGLPLVAPLRCVTLRDVMVRHTRAQSLPNRPGPGIVPAKLAHCPWRPPASLGRVASRQGRAGRRYVTPSRGDLP